MTGSEIIDHLIEHGADASLLDPAMRVAAGGAPDEIIKFVGPERVENLKRVASKAFGKLKTAAAKPEAPPLSVSIPLLEAARDEHREELVDLWASLLALACNPERRASFRNEFIGVVKSLAPHDTRILKLIQEHADMSPNRRDFIASQLQMRTDRVEVSFRMLGNLGLTSTMPNGNQRTSPATTPFGREFLKAVQ